MGRALPVFFSGGALWVFVRAELRGEMLGKGFAGSLGRALRELLVGLPPAPGIQAVSRGWRHC